MTWTDAMCYGFLGLAAGLGVVAWCLFLGHLAGRIHDDLKEREP